MVAPVGNDLSWPFAGVAVLDANSLIDLKRRVSVVQQWQFFSEMTELVRRGKLVFPREVRQELINIQHADVPGAWAAYAFGLLASELSIIDDEHTDEIRIRYYPNAGHTIDDLDIADPYVVGMALTLRSSGISNVVVSEDGLVNNACRDHGIDVMDTDDFIDKVRSAMNPEQSRLID